MDELLIYNPDRGQTPDILDGTSSQNVFLCATFVNFC